MSGQSFRSPGHNGHPLYLAALLSPDIEFGGLLKTTLVCIDPRAQNIVGVARARYTGLFLNFVDQIQIASVSDTSKSLLSHLQNKKRGPEWLQEKGDPEV